MSFDKMVMISYDNILMVMMMKAQYAQWYFQIIQINLKALAVFIKLPTICALLSTLVHIWAFSSNERRAISKKIPCVADITIDLHITFCLCNMTATAWNKLDVGPSELMTSHSAIISGNRWSHPSSSFYFSSLSDHFGNSIAFLPLSSLAVLILGLSALIEAKYI